MNKNMLAVNGVLILSSFCQGIKT